MALLVDRHIHLSGPITEDNLRKYGVRGHKIDDELVKQIVDSQSRRLDDQRTPLPSDPQDEAFLNLVSSIQGSRLDEQRASLHLDTVDNKGSPLPCRNSTGRATIDDEEFLDLLYRCQSSRINKQRSLDPQSYWRSIMPSEDFFNLLQHLQSFRIEDQRSPFPVRT